MCIFQASKFMEHKTKKIVKFTTNYHSNAYLPGLQFKKHKSEKVIRFKSTLIPGPIGVTMKTTTQESLNFADAPTKRQQGAGFPKRKQHEHAYNDFRTVFFSFFLLIFYISQQSF